MSDIPEMTTIRVPTRLAKELPDRIDALERAMDGATWKDDDHADAYYTLGVLQGLFCFGSIKND